MRYDFENMIDFDNLHEFLNDLSKYMKKAARGGGPFRRDVQAAAGDVRKAAVKMKAVIKEAFPPNW